MFGVNGPRYQAQTSMSSNIGNQPVDYHNSGWNSNPGTMFTSSRSSGNGFNNYNPGYGNQPSQNSWNNQQAQSSWICQPTTCPWNNQPAQGSWGNQTSQGMWNNQTNRGSWNMGNHGRAMMRGRMSRGGRAMRARGYGGGSQFNGCNRSQTPAGGDHHCDSCERGFGTPEDLANHLKNDHIVCGLEGCTLSAHPKIVEKHQRMQHDTGLYSRLAAASSGNPDDVQKWINERKRNYPTKENIERKKQETEDCLKRGEPLGLMPESRFGRHRGRGRGGHSFRGRGQSRQEDVSQGGRGYSRGMHKRKFDGRGGRKQRKTKGSQKVMKSMEITVDNAENDEPRDIPMFPGTAHLLGVTLDEIPSSDEDMGDVTGSFSDSEWMEEKEPEVETSSAGAEEGCKKVDLMEGEKGAEVVSNVITLNNALGALMGTYASDDSDEDAPPLVQKIQVRKSKLQCDVEVKGEKQVVTQNLPEPKKESILPEHVPAEAVAKEDVEEESDGSAPEEVPIVKVEERKSSDGLVDGRGELQASKSGGMDEGEGGEKIRRGRKRTRGRKLSTEAMQDGGDEGERAKGKSPARVVKKQCERTTYVRPARHPTLLEELLKNEIRHERNVILQCIRHIVQNDFFDKKPVMQSDEYNSLSSKEKYSVSEDKSSSATVEMSTS